MTSALSANLEDEGLLSSAKTAAVAWWIRKDNWLLESIKGTVVVASDESLDDNNADDDDWKLLVIPVLVEDAVVVCPVARANAFLADFFQ
jgi:hypothetical protein